MMKRFLDCSLALLVVLGAAPAVAQLELPAPSPSAKVMQKVGLTEISVDYSSPGVKGRKVWGELVGWDKPWRAGANAATKITFSKDVTFGGKPVPAGTYAIVTLPSQSGWKVMLNKDLGIFAGKNYDPKEDVVTVPATTAEIPARERLTYLFSDTSDDKTSLDLEWEKLRVSVPIQMNTATYAQANIQAAVEGAWYSLASAARYTAENSKDFPTALKYADNAIAIRSNWYTHWVKAEVLSKSGKNADAAKSAQMALDLGNKDPNPAFFSFYKDSIAKAAAEWKGKK